jgi:DNA-binding NtrC family response regulator
MGKPLASLSPEAERRLASYDFPGNVRELRNLIERAAILESGSAVGPESILLTGTTQQPPPSLPSPFDGDPPPTLEQLERQYLEYLLARARGNRSQVARWMGVSYPTIVKKIADYGIDVSRWKE